MLGRSANWNAPVPASDPLGFDSASTRLRLGFDLASPGDGFVSPGAFWPLTSWPPIGICFDSVNGRLLIYAASVKISTEWD